MITDGVVTQFQMGNFVIKANVGDMTQEESLLQPKPAGNCLNWIVGHVIASRCNLLRGLGVEPVWDEADGEHYARHGAPLTRGENAKSVEELWRGLDETLALLQDTVSKLSAERLAEKAPYIQDDAPGGTIETAIVSYAFHDAYHAGQTGVLRRIIGWEPADL